MRKFASMLAVVATSSTLVMPVAHAEGYFESRIDNARNGFQTRRWADRNADSFNTELTAATCINNPHGSPGKVEFTLRRHESWRPDPHLGTRVLNRCYGGWDRGGWGRQAAGTYYAQLGTFGWNRLTVNWVKVVW